MSRTVPASILTALAQPEVEPFYAVEMLFDDTDGTRWDQVGYAGNRAVRLWTGYDDRTINSEVYVGGGGLLSISGLEEVADLSAKGITISLTGLASSLVSLALQEPYQRRRVRVLFGVRDQSTFVEIFSGLINRMPIEDSPEGGTINVLVDSKLVELERASNWRYTSESHKSRYPNDTFFDFVTAIQDADFRWGR